jgi:hypothetical protein
MKIQYGTSMSAEDVAYGLQVSSSNCASGPPQKGFASYAYVGTS